MAGLRSSKKASVAEQGQVSQVREVENGIREAGRGQEGGGLHRSKFELIIQLQKQIDSFNL